MSYSVVFCLKCQSEKVDVIGWSSRTVATLRCCSCGHQTEVDGFTVGRVFATNNAEGRAVERALGEARDDAAWPRAL